MRGVVVSLFVAMGISCSCGARADSGSTAPAAMVFFDFAKAEVQRDYAAALDAAAAAVVGRKGASVLIEGHSDRPGSPITNRRSSLRRAEAVRQYLLGKGVPAEAMVVRALGEDHPLIATADGVREPQNRRVDVRLVTASTR